MNTILLKVPDCLAVKLRSSIWERGSGFYGRVDAIETATLRFDGHQCCDTGGARHVLGHPARLEAVGSGGSGGTRQPATLAISAQGN